MFNILKKNKDGTVLFMVVSIMMILIVVMMSALVIVTAAQKKAVENFTESQSYITARNVVDTYIGGLSNTAESNYNDLRSALTGRSAGDSFLIDVALPSPLSNTVTLEGGGISVQKIDETSYKISATVTDNFSTNTVSQKITITTGDGVGMFNKAITSLGSCELNSGGSRVLGGYINLGSADITLANNTDIYGSFHCESNLTTLGNNEFYLSQTTILTDSGATYVPDCLESSKNISLTGTTQVINNTFKDDAPVRPYILVQGILSVGGTNGDTKIGTADKPVNIYANEITGMRTQINGDVYCAGDIELSAPNSDINGKIYCNGTVTINGSARTPYDSYSAGVVPALTEYNNYPDVDELIEDSGLTFPSTPPVDMPTNNNTAAPDIDKSCTIRGNMPNGCTLTINVKDKDICITVPDNWLIGDQSRIYIINAETDVSKRGNVYFYTKNATGISISNAYIGVDSGYLGTTHLYGDNYIASNNAAAEKPGNFYWLIDSDHDTQVLTIQNNGVIKGYIYAPGIKYGYSNGGTLTNAKYDKIDVSNVQPAIIGAIIGNNATIQNNMGPIYVRPAKSIFTDLSPGSGGGFMLTKNHYSNN